VTAVPPARPLLVGAWWAQFVARATLPGTDRFAGLDWEAGHGGVPLVTDALASFEFETVAEHPTGDHWIVVGRVDNLRISPTKAPLIFFAGTFHTVQVAN
jgi:flavin reductase (DIM6/NTAB) family NADH-FMN oxidoreductase RutF